MRNIALTKATCSTNVEADLLRGCELFIEDNATDRVYLVNQENVVVLGSDLKVLDVIPWSHDFDSSPSSVDYLQDTCEIFVVLCNGQVVTIHAESHTICSSCFLGETCPAASWSPDQDVLVAVDEDQVVFYGRDFGVIAEWKMTNQDAGKDALVTVGWGAAETQFQGSAGKAAREKRVEVTRTALPTDTHKPYIKWRADGQFVAVSFYEELSGERRVAVFSRDGELMARLKNEEPIEEAIAVRPTGNYIATLKQSVDGRRTMVFYERNGEKRHEMQMPHSVDTHQLVDLQWDVESSCLCVHLRTQQTDELEIWTTSNYDWKRQWSASFTQNIVHWQWHSEKVGQMSLLFGDGCFSRVTFASRPTFVGSDALVVATDELRLTNFDRLPIPPPLCQYSVPHTGAIHVVAFDGSRLAVLDAKFTANIYDNSAESGQFEQKKSVELKGLELVRFVSHLTWSDEEVLAVIHGSSDEIAKVDLQHGVLESLYKSPVPISWLGVQPPNTVMFATADGVLLELKGHDDARVLFTIAASDPYDVKFSGEHVLVLTGGQELFVDGHSLANSVTSYAISDDVCIYTTLQNKLHLMSLTTRKQLGAERAVELGSRLLASTSGTAVIMQMPRGNLETIHPRPFVIRVIKELIDSEKYIEALKEMKKHRIDMNLLVDHKPEVFIANISKLVQLAKDPELICILIAALTSERCALCDGIVISNKVNRVTELLAEEILRLPIDRRIDMFVALLSALLKSSPPQVERALRLIKQHTDEMPVMKRDGYARKWLHHVRFFVNEAMLFNAALATYDLKLTLQVAEVSNRDPKEYVPLLNELRKVEPEDYRKYRIDMARQDWESALRHLSLFDDKWNEAVDLIRAMDLYASALVIYRGSANYKNVCALYAAVLEAKAQWDEAAVLYEKAEDIPKTMRCLEISRNVERYMSRAHLFSIPEDVVLSTLKKMAIVLKSSGRWAEAAKALEIAKCSAASVVEAYANACLWLKAVEIAEESREVSSIRQLLVERANHILGEVTSKSEEAIRQVSRLDVVRATKKEHISRIADGVEDFGDFENADIFSEMGSTMSMASRRTGKTGVSRASTTATVRKRKQIDRKKQSLKEGGEYEDAALLIALAAYYKWLNDLMGEMAELLPALVQVDELSLAGSLQGSVDRIVNEAVTVRHRVWPSKLHPWDLPGPIHALYTVNDTFAFPDGGGMPDVIALEPEIVAPVLDTGRRWKLQILKMGKKTF